MLCQGGLQGAAVEARGLPCHHHHPAGTPSMGREHPPSREPVQPDCKTLPSQKHKALLPSLSQRLTAQEPKPQTSTVPWVFSPSPLPSQLSLSQAISAHSRLSLCLLSLPCTPSCTRRDTLKEAPTCKPETTATFNKNAITCLAMTSA